MNRIFFISIIAMALFAHTQAVGIPTALPADSIDTPIFFDEALKVLDTTIDVDYALHNAGYNALQLRYMELLSRMAMLASEFYIQSRVGR